MELQIEQERIKRGWTLDYIGNEIGLKKSAVSLIMNGKNKPSYDVLVKLENLFKLSHRELLKPAEN